MHSLQYEPAPIFPYAVYFAEAMNIPIWGMPGQFLIHKDKEQDFKFNDLVGIYGDTSMKSQISQNPLWYFKKAYLYPIYKKIKSFFKKD